MSTRHLIIAFYTLLIFLMYSCEDTVDIELADFPPTLVVDAWINNLDGPKTITLSQTANYFEAVATPKIVDASVTVTRNGSETFTFAHTSDGKYVYDGDIGMVGDSYTLDITVNGNTFCSQSVMSRVPAVDSIDVELITDDIFLEDGLYTQFFARDFEGLGDAYWIKTFKNGLYRDNPRELNIAFDAAFDAGSGVDGIIFIPPIREFMNPIDEDFSLIPWMPGESVRVEIHSLTPEAFNWMEIARDQMNNGDNSIFALPVTNTRGNVQNCNSEELALGFFNVSAVTSREKVIE